MSIRVAFFALAAAVLPFLLATDDDDTVDLASSASLSPVAATDLRLRKLLREVFEAIETLSSSSSLVTFDRPRAPLVVGVRTLPASDSIEVARVFRLVGVPVAKFSLDSFIRAKRIGVIRRLGVNRSSDVEASNRCEFLRFGVPTRIAVPNAGSPSDVSAVARRVLILAGSNSSPAKEFLGWDTARTLLLRTVSFSG